MHCTHRGGSAMHSPQQLSHESPLQCTQSKASLPLISRLPERSPASFILSQGSAFPVHGHRITVYNACMHDAHVPPYRYAACMLCRLCPHLALPHCHMTGTAQPLPAPCMAWYMGGLRHCHPLWDHNSMGKLPRCSENFLPPLLPPLRCSIKFIETPGLC